ncbi:MAG TPA: ABC transporter ATP-binding protein [Pyrinomonadaceae bacterium]|jgi:ABC-2 type transport system ATP-binding protein|nr:ABC transporter ATP-binding protein [Pyrinomonadaceae bacterium]
MTNEHVIETSGLAKSYDGVEAVRGIDLKVARGSIYGFLGRNGAGKTTTIKMLLGMTRPCAGVGRVLGRAIDRADESVEIRRRTGFVSEDKGLYDYMTVEQMVRFTRPFYRGWSAELERKYMRAFELPPKRKVRALSKGMRTKLALLLALARAPELLILDEPTEGLDPSMTEELLRLLTGLVAEGVTVFFSSHQIADVEQVADRVCIVNRGRVVLEGALDELKESYRKVNLAYGEASPPPAAFATPGVRQVSREGRWLSLFVSDNAERIADEARSGGALAADVVPVGLKEIFLETVKEETLDTER